MHGLIVLPTDALGGAENVLKMLATQFCAVPGNELHVVFMSRGDRGWWRDLADKASLHYIAARRESIGAPSAAALITRLSRRRPFDIALSSHTHCNGFLGALRGLGLLRTRALVVRESTLIGRRFVGVKRLLLNLIYRCCYGPVDLIVCQTPHMQDELFKFIPLLRTKRTAVLPNPVDAANVRALAAQSASVPAGAYVVAMGRLVPVKGFDVLLQAFARAMQEHAGVSLVIVGEGEQREPLQQLARTLGISERVILPGHQRNPFPFARGAIFGVVSSRIEGFPNVVLEMLSVGLPVVSTRCADGLDELPNVTLCRPEDVGALADALADQYRRLSKVHATASWAYLDERSPRRFLERLLALAGVPELSGPPAASANGSAGELSSRETSTP
jgi:glycosyltransferase involved in cell wall biosynthesis